MRKEQKKGIAGRGIERKKIRGNKRKKNEYVRKNSREEK
jgi:hypothetical protein